MSSITQSGNRQKPQNLDFWYQYIYDVDKLEAYHNFDIEHQKLLTGETNYNQIARKTMLALQIILIISTACIFKPYNLLVYFTNWTLLLQTASIYCSIKATSNPKFSEDTGFLAWNHILYSMCIIFNFIVVSVYWTMIHHETVQSFYPHEPVKYTQQVIVHIQPALFCIINSYITNIVMTKTLIKPLAAVFWVYSFVNFLQTKNTGKPLYSFLPWDSFQTVVTLIYMLSGFSGIYLTFCYVDEAVKMPLKISENKKVEKSSDSTKKMN